MKYIYMLEIRQPIGTFYVGKMYAQDILNISFVSRRKGGQGHQRLLKEKRAKEIALYCKDPDATFPTPIILSVNYDDFKNKDCPIPGVVCFEFNETKRFAEILDGQHRMAGISKSDELDFELPVIIMFSLSEEQKGYVFSTINGNQAKVDRSLIYDLFALNKTPSPYKTCHQIARIMNSDPKSPFYRRLKMLEKRENRLETISQSTFVTNLCEYLISKNSQEDEINIKRKIKLEDNPKLPLRKYFISGKDEVILRILMNYFTAAESVFSKEWNNPDEYILTKSVGFEGMISALATLIPTGEKLGDLSKEYFVKIFRNLKNHLHMSNIELTSQSFSSSSQNANRLAKLIIDSNNSLYE
ncbi:MAG: DGQHR domain-containing protein [Clostridia bacterium]|nr:DGQHR domain-containing protein [Clostridia bacterium]